MKHFYKATLNSLILFSATALLMACEMENEDDRKLAEATACIDEAASSDDSQADLCIAKVDGLTSSQSYLIRCSANMIAQGFSGSRVASAYEKLKDGEGNKTASMLAYLVFARNLTRHSADITLENCTKSGVKSVTFLATMIKTATFAASLAGSLEGSAFDPSSENFDPTQLQTQLAAMASSATSEQKTTIGELAELAQTTYCESGTTMADQDVCQKLNSAITDGDGDAEQIGAALLALLGQS